MTRAISVVAAVIVLLAVGWFFGNRPVSGLKRTLAEERQDCEEQVQQIRAEARKTEALGHLWTVEGELILAGQDVTKKNFGTASGRVTRARDLLIAAGEALDTSDELAPMVAGVRTALQRIEALDPSAGEPLLRTAADLNSFLESEGRD